MRAKHNCTPGAACFECPWPDCGYNEKETKLERKMKRDGASIIARLNTGNHSPVKGKWTSVYYGGECKTTKASPAEIEQMLAERWPGKIEPIRHALPTKFAIK